MADEINPPTQCSFCGSTAEEVGEFVRGNGAGAEVRICSRCAQEADRVFEPQRRKAVPLDLRLASIPKPEEIVRHLDQQVISQAAAKRKLAVAVTNHAKRLIDAELRESMSEDRMAHPEMDALLDESLQAAIHLLEKNGEFFPFGVTMASDGEIKHVHAQTGDEQPPSQQVIELLLAGMKAGAANGEYKATALVFDARVSKPGAPAQDAIGVTVEHHINEPVTCYLPYTHTAGKHQFGELLAERAERRVFP